MVFRPNRYIIFVSMNVYRSDTHIDNYFTNGDQQEDYWSRTYFRVPKLSLKLVPMKYHWCSVVAVVDLYEYFKLTKTVREWFVFHKDPTSSEISFRRIVSNSGEILIFFIPEVRLTFQKYFLVGDENFNGSIHRTSQRVLRLGP